MKKYPIPIPEREVAAFCARHKIRSLALFGSVLRDDFGPQSDVDVLVEFDPGAEHDLWNHYEMKEELARLLGRNVDLINRQTLENSQNWIRRRAILESAETIYAS